MIANVKNSSPAESALKNGSANQDPTTGAYVSNLTQMLIDS